jgi:hypothetical protein
MNRFYTIFLLLTATILFNSCEKDDLCTPDQAVTPRMVIEFKDALSPSENKAVDRIQVQEIGSSDFAPLDSAGSTSLNDTETISIPLRTNSSTTSYNFVLTKDGTINSDNIDFSYVLEEEYVSRACGFRIIYNNLSYEQIAESTGTPWIQQVVVVAADVTNNTDIHVQILH